MDMSWCHIASTIVGNFNNLKTGFSYNSSVNLLKKWDKLIFLLYFIYFTFIIVSLY